MDRHGIPQRARRGISAYGSRKMIGLSSRRAAAPRTATLCRIYCEEMTPMSKNAVFAVALFAAFAVAAPIHWAAAQTPAKEETKATASEKKAAKAEKKAKASEARKAAHVRQKQCGSEWKDARAAGKVEKFMTWPKYYSECNKRLKDKAA
jgi:uncharacterized protein (DUF2147 family)